MCCLTILLNFWWFGATRSPLNSWLYIANTVWSCSDLVICFCTNLREHFPEASHSFPKRSDPILYRNLGRHHPVSKYWTNPTGSELYRKLWLIESGHREIIFLNADAILASSISKSRKDSPPIDCDVIWSSDDLAISTSWIHDIVSSGVDVLTHTSVLKLTLQNWQSCSWNFPKCRYVITQLGVSIVQLWE